MRRATCRFFLLAVAVATAVTARAQENSADAPYRQSRSDAWWTGPILAPSANTLAKGHVLFEPYFYDVMSQGRYDADGTHHGGDRSHSLGSSAFLIYGLTDLLSIGLIPRVGFNDVKDGPDSSGIRIGDTSLQAQYRLTQFREGSRIPTISLVLGETLPTGRYDRLGTRPSDALGAGAYTTTLSVYSQYFFWMPNGRILRTRFNVSYALSDSVNVDDVSVYGTDDGFRGHARPGSPFVATAAWEYSVTRKWVLALDVEYQHESPTEVTGLDFPVSGPPIPVRIESRSRETVRLAPAVEYNWNSRMGIIVGMVFTAAGRNAGATVIPVTAVNMVF